MEHFLWFRLEQIEKFYHSFFDPAGKVVSFSHVNSTQQHTLVHHFWTQERPTRAMSNNEQSFLPSFPGANIAICQRMFPFQTNHLLECWWNNKMNLSPQIVPSNRFDSSEMIVQHWIWWFFYLWTDPLWKIQYFRHRNYTFQVISNVNKHAKCCQNTSELRSLRVARRTRIQNNLRAQFEIVK